MVDRPYNATDIDLEHLGECLIELGSRAAGEEPNSAIQGAASEVETEVGDTSTVTLTVSYGLLEGMESLEHPVRHEEMEG